MPILKKRTNAFVPSDTPSIGDTVRYKFRNWKMIGTNKGKAVLKLIKGQPAFNNYIKGGNFLNEVCVSFDKIKKIDDDEKNAK